MTHDHDTNNLRDVVLHTLKPIKKPLRKLDHVHSCNMYSLH